GGGRTSERRGGRDGARAASRGSALSGLALPGGEVEVVAPGGDLVVADLHDAGARENDALACEGHAIDALGEDDVAERRDVEELGLELVGEEEHVQDLADAVLPGD